MHTVLTFSDLGLQNISSLQAETVDQNDKVKSKLLTSFDSMDTIKSALGEMYSNQSSEGI